MLIFIFAVVAPTNAPTTFTTEVGASYLADRGDPGANGIFLSR